MYKGIPLYFCSVQTHYMKNIYALLALAFLIVSCGNKEEAPVTLCDKPCVSDTLSFSLPQNEFEPFVKLIPSNCLVDTVVWSSKVMPTKRKIHLSTMLGMIPSLDKSTIKCYIKDTSFAFLVFNDCLTRRGFWLKLGLGLKGEMEKSLSSFNPADPRYKVEEGLIYYKANNTFFVQDIMSGKKASVELPSPKLEFDNTYEVVDSVNVSRSRIYMKLNDEGKEVNFEKSIELK